jgi:NADH:ubiquinone oxidoreductase subunit 2 (subunit N)
VFSFFGVLMVLKSFTERKKAFMSFILIIMNHFWIALAISFNEQYSINETLLYLSGIVVAGIIGYLSLARLKKLEHEIDLNQFHGYSYKHPRIALVFLLSCLGVTGFPITTAFIGEDLIFSHIHEDQIGLAFFTALSLVINGLATVRIYARVFLGPHIKTYHEVAKRSS